MGKFFELLLQNISGVLDLITFIRYCNEGFNIIRKTCGKPGKIYKKAGLCFKFPLIQAFDVVNMKKQVHFLNAHSYMHNNTRLVPYNITLDAQVEYKVIDPYVIYKIDIEDSSRETIRIYIDNEVHLLISELLKNEPQDAQKELDLMLEERNKKAKSYLEKAILIERIVISAYDYNIAIKHTQ